MRRKAGRLFPVMAWAALVTALLTVTMGGVVRVTGSGLGCPDWPLCHGRAIPPANLGSWLEYSHRLSAAGVILFTVLALVTGFGRYTRLDKRLYLVLLVPVVLLAQAVLGGLTVLLDLSPKVALAHTGLAAALVGLLALVVAGTGGASQTMTRGLDGDKAREYWRLLAILTIATFLMVLSGAYVTRTGASLACLGLPLCGDVQGGMSAPQWAHMVHRGMAAVVIVLMVFAVVEAWALRSKAILVATVLLTSVLAVQIGLGVTNVALRLPPWSRGAHLALAFLFFGGLMWMAGTLWRALQQREGAPTLQWQGGARKVRAYFQLTSPRIVLLLLLSTAAAMFAAAGGGLPWTKVVGTLIGGALCAGGAKAVNAYLDRDVDKVMRRTRGRPLPLQQVSPRGALIFGIGISALSLAFFLWVHPLTAILAAAAWVYYVVFYSVYLKHRTSQNVVIGGAAGAFPPLIGWTAAMGHIELAAVFLFLIVFFWTPPHAWALMMLLKEDYRRVHIPMLPAIRSDRDTGRQILVYSVVLTVLTLIPVALHLFGLLYLATAVLLGSLFLWLAVKIYWSHKTSWARRLYRYSTLYLALLFLGLALDRAFLG